MLFREGRAPSASPERSIATTPCKRNPALVSMPLEQFMARTPLRHPALIFGKRCLRPTPSATESTYSSSNSWIPTPGGLRLRARTIAAIFAPMPKVRRN